MRLYYNSATPPAETWVRVSAIVDWPQIVSRKDFYGLCIVTLRDFQGGLYATWGSRDLTEMKVTDDAGTPNTLFRGYLINKKFHAKDLVLEIAGLGIMLYRRSFGSEEIMNYILSSGYPKTLNASSIIDLQYKDSDGDFQDFGWDVDYWILSDRNVALVIKDQTAGFASLYWDCEDPIAQTNGVVQLGDFASTITYDDADYYSVRDSSAPNMFITPTMSGVPIANTKKLKSIELEYSFRLRVNSVLVKVKARVKLQIKKDTEWITIDQVYAERILGTHTSNWVNALSEGVKEGGIPHIITEGGDSTELAKYFTDAGGNFTELKEMRLIITGSNPEGYVEVHVDYLRAKISYHDDDVLPIMEPITDSTASTVTCATVANWQDVGVTIDVDAFQIAENTPQIIQDVMSQAGLNFWIESPGSFTKYMARKFKGKHCIEPLKAVCDLEGSHWIEDYVNNRIVIIKPADYVDSTISLTQANYEHEWEIEDQCNQVKYIYVWGKTSINEATQSTVNIFAKAVSKTATGEKSMQIIDDNIMTQPEAQEIANTQLALLEAKRPSIRVPLDGVNILLQLGAYVNLTMARPTVGAADYKIRMIQRSKFGKTGIKTVVYCGLGETHWDELIVKEIKKLQLETHKALTDRLESTPYDVGVGGVVWDDIGGRVAGVEAISYTKAEIDAINAIGIANKRWIPCLAEGERYPASSEISIYYQNKDGQDNQHWFSIPLPLIIGGTHNLVITQTNVGIFASDNDDYITTLRWYGWSAYDTFANIVTDGTDRKNAQLVTWNHADIAAGANYVRMILLCETVATNALDLKIAFVLIEYYYA